MNTFLDRKKIDIVFIDWFGVLSTSYFWCVQSKKNMLLKEWCNFVFNDSEIFNDWMRGKYSLEYLTQFGVEVNEDLLVKSFLKDMKYYKPDYKFLKSVKELFPNAKKILVTDNMLIFDYILKEYTYLNSYFDKMYLSYEIGMLKNDTPKSMFDYILNDLGLTNFENCLLIDDNSINCQNFNDKNGRTIFIK